MLTVLSGETFSTKAGRNDGAFRASSRGLATSSGRIATYDAFVWVSMRTREP